MNDRRKSLYNIVFGIFGQLVVVVMGVLLPRLFITTYGSSTNGFISSINAIITYLALLEAGVGAATIQALYRPIAVGDKGKINGILAATNFFYRKTGYFYFGLVVVLAVFFPFFSGSELSIPIQIGIILLLGGSGALGYFFQAKYRLLLQAEGKKYVIANVNTVIQVAVSVAKIVLILCNFSVIWLQVAQFILTICQICFYAYYIKKKYSWLNLNVKPDNESISQKNNVLVHQIAEMVFNNTDVIVLTIFTNLRVVSVYVLYLTFIDMISVFIGQVNEGFIFKLGQTYNADRPAFEHLFDTYERYYMAFSFALYCVAFMFLPSFMRLYTAGITDVNYMLKWLPFLFISYKLMVSGRAVCGVIISVAGHFKATQWRAVAESVINLSVSIVATIVLENKYHLGIYGVLLGTVVALLYRANDMIIYANRHVLHRNVWKSYAKWLTNLSVFILAVQCFKFYSSGLQIENYMQLFVKAAVVSVITLTIFFGVNALVNKRECLQMIRIVKSMLYPNH